MLRLAIAMLLCCAPVGAVRALAADKEPQVAEVASLDADQSKHVEIVSQMISADGRELTIVLKPITELFTVDFDLTGQDFKRVRITVRGVKNSQVARYFPDLKRRQVYIELKDIPGVDISRSGADTVIDFATAKAAKVLPPEGRFMFKEAPKVEEELKPKKK